ncbi:MAG: YgiQ family radical SAM protein [Deltaproteobacteria bacterium]|nr:YgiQ family radical SAM protein [Deltaproteobacteria bacterium]MBI3293453.1 YgiQ family radical SAM protein [Deltaproteobacteria bacterium]
MANPRKIGKPSISRRNFIPISAEDVRERGWDSVDVVLVTGDAYVDHPSFAMAILGRVLDRAGFKVAILSQPEWKSCEPFKRFGRPNLFFGVSAGNMDSMINHRTANKKIRNDDAYSPGGRTGLRPDRATLVYTQRAREAYKGVPVIAGGVEASLRRLAHYDYWSDTVKRSILLDSKADLVAYGMGEENTVAIAERLRAGGGVASLRSLRGVAYALGARETPPVEFEGKPFVSIPSFEGVASDKFQFAEATRLIHTHTNPFNAHGILQKDGARTVVATPPAFPLSQSQMDAIYDLPYTRLPHPDYSGTIPAYEMIKDSVTIMRGCFGGCTFCSITTHQGRIIQSRSQESIIKEVENLAKSPTFAGTVSDIGGPTANMYQMRCTRPEVEKVCRRQSCVDPTICKLLGTDHGPLVEVMKAARSVEGVNRVMVASGVRMDLAERSPEYVEELAAHHVGGLLKVAPEHSDPEVLSLMKKPSIESFERFGEQFVKASEKAGKPKQYLVPYFIASHPGSDLNAMIDLALFLKRNGYRPDQVQDFIPAPFDVATCMYYTGIDPFTKKEVKVAKHLGERKLQRALLQFFKPENYFEVREALERANRRDLIGNHCNALIPASAPQEAIIARREKANMLAALKTEGQASGHGPRRPRGDGNTGYRPFRKEWRGADHSRPG